MNSVILLLKNLRIHQILIAVFVGITLFFSTGLGQEIQAIACPIPTVATYQTDDADTVRTNKTLPSQYLDEDLAGNAQKNLKKNTDTVKDKLNLNNQISADNKAKEFVENAKERAEQAGKTAQRSFDNFSQTDR